MRRLLTFVAACVLGVFALTSAAGAQDWSGIYFGANLGGAWGQTDAKADVGCPASGYFCTGAVAASNGPFVAGQGTGSISTDNVIGGVQTGYNAQSGGFVYGFEVDFSSFNLDGSRQATANFPNPSGVDGNTFTIGSALGTNWLFTARGRLGWSVSHVLLYATGGLALTDLKVTTNYRDNLAVVGVTPGGSLFAENTDVKAGFTVGGGAEWFLAENWTVRAEYLYVDFGSVSAGGNASSPDFSPAANPISISEDLSAHIARAGVNYRFSN